MVRLVIWDAISPIMTSLQCQLYKNTHVVRRIDVIRNKTDQHRFHLWYKAFPHGDG